MSDCDSEPFCEEASEDRDRLQDENDRLRAALEGALVILESMPRPTAGLISNNVQAEFDRRLAAVRAALGYQQTPADKYK